MTKIAGYNAFKDDYCFLSKKGSFIRLKNVCG